MVLIHGVGLNKEMWGGQFVGLANDYRVIAYDMLGHGQSALPAADIGLEGYAAQLQDKVARLREQINARISAYNEHTRALNELRNDLLE